MAKYLVTPDHFSSYNALPSNFKATLVPENIHNFANFFFSKFCSFFIYHISYFMKVWEISASAILIADDIISGWFPATSDIKYCQRLPSSAKMDYIRFTEGRRLSFGIIEMGWKYQHWLCVHEMSFAKANGFMEDTIIWTQRYFQYMSFSANPTR